MIQKIIPNLWFDKEAKEATQFYVSLFPDSKITNTSTLHNTPSGDTEIISFEISGQSFMAISAGPYFKINPSVSFLFACETGNEVEELWKKLSVGGTPLMELGEYPFSKKYGWIQDRYGVSWQLMEVGDLKPKQKITPTLMFTGKVCGKAEEAIKFYAFVFRDSVVGVIDRYGKGEEPDREGTVRHAEFSLENQSFAAMDSALAHKFSFNEAVSFVIQCRDQKEIDYFWEKLSAHPMSEQCGWLKDKYGLSWQVIPVIMDEMMKDTNKERLARVTKTLLKMKKLDLAQLERAYAGS